MCNSSLNGNLKDRSIGFESCFRNMFWDTFINGNVLRKHYVNHCYYVSARKAAPEFGVCFPNAVFEILCTH
jgi:hypothetical protein